jgi:hypothetical protein
MAALPLMDALLSAGCTRAAITAPDPRARAPALDRFCRPHRIPRGRGRLAFARGVCLFRATDRRVRSQRVFPGSPSEFTRAEAISHP